MRPLLALLISTLTLGGLAAYMQFRPRPRALGEADPEIAASGIYSLELIFTFRVGPDEFAVGDTSSPALEVLFRGETIVRETGEIPADSPLVVEPVEGIVEGDNEFFISASASEDRFDRYHAARVIVKRDGVLLANDTLWAEPGMPLEGAVIVHIRETDRSSALSH